MRTLTLALAAILTLAGSTAFANGDDNHGHATRIKKGFRLEHSVATDINADPATIWALLTDAAGYTAWNSTVVSLDGEIADGEKIAIISTLAPDRTFTLKVKEVVPGEQMAWIDGARGISRGVRTYMLSPVEGGATTFTMVEVLSGLMVPMIAGAIPDMRESFEQIAADLKRAAESRS